MSIFLSLLSPGDGKKPLFSLISPSTYTFLSFNSMPLTCLMALSAASSVS